MAHVTHVIDDFCTSRLSTSGPNAAWFYFSAGPYVGDDGIEAVGDGRLYVRAKGSNQTTGNPAFTQSMPPERSQGAPGLPGGLDHVKWLAYAAHPSSQGLPGWDAPDDGSTLTFDATFSGATFGTAGHQFGDAVAEPEDDLRLASFMMSCIDLETLMVFDYFVTNRSVYAFYERLPYERDRLGRYASFTSVRRVGDNAPGLSHRFQISYNRRAGTVRWVLDDREVFAIDQIGCRAERDDMILDHGGEELAVRPRQLTVGFGIMTLLDAAERDGQPLVRLSSAEDFYFDPRDGEPKPATFIDEQSTDQSRLFGQGAEITIERAHVIVG